MISRLEKLDRDLFLAINGQHSDSIDQIMLWLSGIYIWIPLYLALIGLLIYVFRRKSIAVLLGLTGLVLLTDAGINYLIKHQVRRLRPCHNENLSDTINLVAESCGGKYGFVSNHASNTFGLAMFLCLVLPRRYLPLKIFMLFWAFAISYSRVYVGVHYPADVLFGGLFGILLALLVYTVLKRLNLLKLPDSALLINGN